MSTTHVDVQRPSATVSTTGSSTSLACSYCTPGERVSRTIPQPYTEERPASETLLGSTFREGQSLAALTESRGSASEIAAIFIDGERLTSSELIAVACHGVAVQISPDPRIKQRVESSVNYLARCIEEGHVIYGVNTGFGGSADVRSDELLDLQKALIQMQTSGVLLPSDFGRAPTAETFVAGEESHHMSRVLVRASMLVRCNSLLRGHSAVRFVVIQNILDLLNRDCTPIIPLRGSISASGDLAPLSYIAATLEGNEDIFVHCPDEGGTRRILTASAGLRQAGVTPITLLPKEGLGLINGTAVSCSAATLVLHKAQHLVIAAQVLTGMCTEALGGSKGNFDPFISAVRPHPGQREVAENITNFLQGSQFAHSGHVRSTGLSQDRYATRTAPQWIGPQLEDMAHAIDQVGIELNSSTDNPLVDVERGLIHHGGNFQAVSVTSAMERARLALQMLGKMMFAQCSELINPMLNNTLSPNLAFDDPSISFTFKSVDINFAAYMSELAFLSNPVSTHVQSAEMHNQSVNSLALISARYSQEAAKLVSLMTATLLYTACQGLDLRALHVEYSSLILIRARAIYDRLLIGVIEDPLLPSTWRSVCEQIQTSLVRYKNEDTITRSQLVADATLAPILRACLRRQHPASTSRWTAGNDEAAIPVLSILEIWAAELASTIQMAIFDSRKNFCREGPTTLQYLGQGSAKIYRFVRQELQVPLHKGLVEHSTFSAAERGGAEMNSESKVTIGNRISTVFQALEDGRLHSVLVDCLRYDPEQ